VAQPGTAAAAGRRAATQNLNLGVYLILLVRSSILSVANANNDVSCAEPKVRVVSNVINAHIFLFSNELWHRIGCHEPGALYPPPEPT
jgi:hypothetical protein